MFPIRLASLNIQTLHNSTRLVSFIKILTDNNIDVACLQETLNLGKGTFKLKKYKFFYKGQEHPDPKPKHGVGIAIKKQLLKKIDFSKGSILTERIYHLILTIKGTLHIHIISVYAPQKDLSDNEKYEFYDILKKIISNISVSEIVFLLGDYNAHVGKGSPEWSNIIGPYGYGKINKDGKRLLRFCESNHLLIANTHFGMPEEERYTYESGNGVKTQLDLCIIRQSDKKYISQFYLFNHNLPQLSHKMLMVNLNEEELIKRAEMTPIEKLLLELKYQLDSLHSNDTTECFKKEWQLFGEHVDETLLKTIGLNETKIRLSLSDFVLRNERLKKQVTECVYESEKIDFDKSFSELFMSLRLKDALISSLNNSNDSIFNDDFTIELGFEAAFDVKRIFNELSVIKVEDAINLVITNTATNISTLSIHPEDLKQIFQPKESGSFFKLLQICWVRGIIPKEILIADVFHSRFAPFSNTIFVFSVFSDIFQHCIYRKLKIVIEQQESKHGFIMSFSHREFLFSINLMFDRILNMDNVFIALLDLSKVFLALNTDDVINYLEKNLKDCVSKNIFHFLKSFLVKSKIYTKADKTTNEKSNIYKMTMQFFWSCVLSNCFKKENAGINSYVYVDLLLFKAYSKETLECYLQSINEYLKYIIFDYKELNVSISASIIVSHDDMIFNCFGKQIQLSPSITILGRSFGFTKEIRTKEIIFRIETAREETEKIQYSLKPSEDINATLKRYTDNILEPLLFNIDIVTLDSSQEDLLNRFHFQHFVIKIQDRKNFVLQLSLLATKSIPTILSYRRLVLFGNVTRLSANSKVKRLLLGDYVTSQESETYLRLCSADLQKFNITYETCEIMDRDMWIKTLDKKLSDLE